ncbi:MAG: hypothetical protein JRI23_21165 [Deltaproteobacteria bacterium]|jgi:hypothetical protein|nr:hypothetical protein [Deltaproteobacteria bacterium]MBW2534445.1 hypothetical protein [Deltaproteobacteria bacterium]
MKAWSILLSSALAVALVGCGSDDDGNPRAADDGAGGSGAASSGGGSGGAPVPDGEVVVSVTVESTANADQAEVPVTFAQVFHRGQVGATRTLVGQSPDEEPIPVQVDAKASHDDGSLRHAIITAIVPTLPAGGTQVVELALASEGLGGEPVSVADLLATDFDAALDLDVGGTIYRASARQLLSTETPQVWFEGPLVSEWHVSAPVAPTDGSPHAHLMARFRVRAYQGLSQVRVATVVENAWAFEPEPQSVGYDATISIQGQSPIVHAGLTHYRQARWRQLGWWGTEPGAFVRHDRAYLLASRAVPHLDPSLVISDDALDALAASWSEGSTTGPLGSGSFVEYMPTTGAHVDIGPLAKWDSLHLCALDRRSAPASFGHGELAGSWSIHYRDEDTDLPVTLVDYPYMTLLGNPGDAVNPDTGQSELFPACGGDCSTPLSPDSAHQPSMGYLPYLLSGDLYFLEEVQFWANWNMLRSNPHYREFEHGLLKPDQVRGQGWSLRTLGWAAYITPDDHPLKGYFDDRLADNIAWYVDRYVDGSENQLGFLTHTNFPYNDGRGQAPWQNDFFGWAVGQVVDLGYEEARPLLEWVAQSPVGRMTAPGYCWIQAASYSLNLRDDASSPVYATFAEAFQGTFDPELSQVDCASQEMADLLDLELGEMTGYAHSPTGYPSNMQPALAAAVDAGIAGAAEAWDRFMNRSVQPDYADFPNFAVVPRP